MRRIAKNHELRAFTEWKAQGNPNWVPTYDNLQNPEKNQLHSALLSEQGFTCCYCGREIDLMSSHIEHFRPQTRYQSLALNYDNLIVSCIRETRPGNPLHCGHLKGDWFDETRAVSPLQHDVESQFSYLLTGDVMGRSGAAAEMISVLGLNISFLKSRRSQALQAVFDPDFIAVASEVDLLKIANSFRQLGNEGRLGSFFQAIARFAEQLANRIEEFSGTGS
jgi:uncharacterized protein (TIGR02646 family)